MRVIIGVIILLFVLTGAVLTVLALWGIQPISWAIVWKSGATIVILGVAAIITSIVYYFFLKKDPFNRKKNNNSL
ncbi:MAG: hypothetical protein ACLVKO_12130 [Dysgonomonas sp.]